MSNHTYEYRRYFFTREKAVSLAVYPLLVAIIAMCLDTQLISLLSQYDRKSHSALSLLCCSIHTVDDSHNKFPPLFTRAKKETKIMARAPRRELN